MKRFDFQLGAGRLSAAEQLAAEQAENLRIWNATHPAATVLPTPTTAAPPASSSPTSTAPTTTPAYVTPSPAPTEGPTVLPITPTPQQQVDSRYNVVRPMNIVDPNMFPTSPAPVSTTPTTTAPVSSASADQAKPAASKWPWIIGGGIVLIGLAAFVASQSD